MLHRYFLYFFLSGFTLVSYEQNWLESRTRAIMCVYSLMCDLVGQKRKAAQEHCARVFKVICHVMK